MAEPQYNRDQNDGATIVPTDVISMRCTRCGQQYTKGKSPLPINGNTRLAQPCTGMPRNPFKEGPCGSTEYEVMRRMDVKAAPRGTWMVDLSRKRS